MGKRKVKLANLYDLIEPVTRQPAPGPLSSAGMATLSIPAAESMGE